MIYCYLCWFMDINIFIKNILSANYDNRFNTNSKEKPLILILCFHSLSVFIDELIYYSIVVTILPVLHFQWLVIWYWIPFMTVFSNSINLIKFDLFHVKNSLNFLKSSLYLHRKVYKNNSYKCIQNNTNVIKTIFPIIFIRNLSEAVFELEDTDEYVLRTLFP
jgi:hypothetical protein